MAFALFAIGMIGTGLLAVPILSGSAAYAVKEFFGLKGSLAVKPRYRPTFYAVLAAATVAGLVMNLVHLDPIKALFWSAVLNGVVAPPLLVLIVLLGADKQLMKSKVSGRLSKSLTSAAAVAMTLAAVAMFATLLLH
jgi:Mn2+/Fe2+ NRAMP family transporter